MTVDLTQEQRFALRALEAQLLDEVQTKARGPRPRTQVDDLAAARRIIAAEKRRRRAARVKADVRKILGR